MTLIKLVDARRGLNKKCLELFSDSKIAEAVYRYLCDGIEECEDADLERKKGKWMWDGESRREYPYKCSECGKIDYYAFLYDSETREFEQQDNFCPNCGADMRGENNG